MNFELSQDQEMLRDSVRRFLSERAPIDTYVRARLASSVGESDDVWQGLAELGLHGLLVSEAHGGGGLGMVEMGVVCEELGRGLYPGSFVPTAIGAASLLQEADGQAALLTGLSAGEIRAAVALYEPDCGYDWRHCATRAAHDGGTWRLHGTKRPVPGGTDPDVVLVVARDDRGLGLFCVEGREGMRFEALAGVDPTSPLVEIDLRAAPAVRVGPDDAEGLVARTLDRLAVGMVADGLGAAARAFELSAAYAHERQQFGKTIGSFQAVQHLLVDMLQDIELARAATYYALWALDEADPSEAHRAATMAQAFASRAFPEIGANAIQLFGGIGYTWEHDVHLFYKRLLTVQHLYGDEGEQLDELARLVVDEAS